MNNYEQLIKALRDLHRDPRPSSAVWLFDNQIALYDAADAIEALQAAEPTEKQVVDYCHKRCLVVLEADLFHEMKASYGKTPKRGEWIDRYDEHDKPFFKRKYVCSACGNWNTYGKSNYCPKCGAKMEVQK